MLLFDMYMELAPPPPKKTDKGNSIDPNRHLDV